MERKEWTAGRGTVAYWTTEGPTPDRPALVFLPGLSAEHHLFDRQLPHFEKNWRCLTWDAPGHGESRPYAPDFTLEEIAAALHAILELENAERPVLIGQSFGGYIGQMYMELYPGGLSGFVSIDSAPLQADYYTDFDLWFFRHMEPMYRMYPNLVPSVVRQCAETEQGRSNMRSALSLYSKAELCRLSGRGYLCLYEAIRENRPYEIDCPALLLCGEKDRAGYTKRFNRRWSNRAGIPLAMVPAAGHNSNMDRSAFVNRQIDDFLSTLF